MKTGKKIFIAFLLNLFFSIFEFFGGIYTGSIAILSDSVHDLGDAASIGLSALFERKSQKQPNENYTYGYARYSVLGGAITTLTLILASGIVIYNAVQRFFNPREIDYNGTLIFACIGLIVNALATYFTHGGKSANQRAVNLHMLEDVLGWLVILVGAIVMRFTHFSLLDPILSIFVAIFILLAAVKNLWEILRIFLLQTPKDVHIEELKTHLLKIDGVEEVHHVHVWAIDEKRVCATLHIAVARYDSRIKRQVKEALYEHGITHVVVEMEEINEQCLEKKCEIKQVQSCSCGHCGHHH